VSAVPALRPGRRSSATSWLARAGVAAGALAGLSLAATLLDRRDRRAVLADPQHAVLSRPRPGRPLSVQSSDGTALHAEVSGPDHAPTIVLVHGWLSSSRIWHHQVQALSDDLRVVTCDLRGHGRSAPAATGDYSTAALADDLAAVLDHTVPAGERVVVAGHSMGAMVVVAWADSHRKQADGTLAGAVLASTGVDQLIGRARILATVAGLSGVREAVGRRLIGAPLPWPSHPRPLVSRLVHAAVLGPDASPAQVDFCTRMVLASPAKVRAAFGATLSTLDLTAATASLTVPSVVVAGAHDRLTPPVHARAMVETLPRATLVEVAGVGHMTPLEAPAEVTGAIRVVTDLALGATPG
jgi:pimeloyl-ACP methyl ester carboxylesterase